eukprot:gene38899-48031_t
MTCHVTKLVLYDFNLHGSIPISFGNLTYLKQVQLSFNDITGSLPISPIPPDLGIHWSGLRVLNIKYNAMTGPIPDSFLRWFQLEILFLGDNHFTGTVENLMNMTAAYYMDFPENSLTGTFPASISNLAKNLMTLETLENHFTGTLPESIGMMTTLTYLSLDHNEFTGAVPLALFDCFNLWWLYMDNNRFTGPNPLEIAFSTFGTNLLELSIGNNHFTGSLPTASFNLVPKLAVLMAGDNRLTGTIPAEITTLSLVTILDVSHNALVGTIPSDIGDCNKLLW